MADNPDHSSSAPRPAKERRHSNKKKSKKRKHKRDYSDEHVFTDEEVSRKKSKTQSKKDKKQKYYSRSDESSTESKQKKRRERSKSSASKGRGFVKKKEPPFIPAEASEGSKPGQDKHEEAANVTTTNRRVEPSPWSLRCRDVPDSNQHQVLWWEAPQAPIPLSIEESLIETLMQYGKKENGMFLKQSPRRIDNLRKICRKKRVPLIAALSLRRHHIRRLNMTKSMSQLGLGRYDDIRESARLFEVAIAEYLKRRGVGFYSEAEQIKFIRKNMPKVAQHPVTPDFILRDPVRIKTFFYSKKDETNKGRHVAKELSIHWIEAKMFYGASTIEPDGKSAVGSLLNTARKYVRFHGPGAMVFMQGFGDRLANELFEIGVLALDCWSSEGVVLARVEKHQRKWCADRDGNILP